MRLRRDDSRIGLTLTSTEAIVLLYVCDRIVDALAAPDEDERSRRLLPDAYPDDPRESAEFRRFSREETVHGKTADAHTLQTAVRPAATSDRRRRAGTEVWVQTTDLGAWLRALTSARLVLGSELGLFGNTAHLDPQTPDLSDLRDVFDWLGYLQEALLAALEDSSPETIR